MSLYNVNCKLYILQFCLFLPLSLSISLSPSLLPSSFLSPSLPPSVVVEPITVPLDQDDEAMVESFDMVETPHSNSPPCQSDSGESVIMTEFSVNNTQFTCRQRKILQQNHKCLSILYLYTRLQRTHICILVFTTSCGSNSIL